MKKFLSVLLAVMMVFSSVSFAAPTAVKTADFEQGSYVSADDSAEFAAEDVWYDAQMGIKLFVIDLDGDTKYTTAALSQLSARIDGTSDNNASNGLYLSAIGRVNPDYSSYADTFKYSFKDGGTPTVEGTDDKYFMHTTSTRSSVMVANPFVGDGAYTLVFNHSADTEFTIHSGYTGGTVTETPVDSQWTTAAYTIDIAEQGSDDYIRMYASSAPGTYSIDDVALFYKPDGWTAPDDGEDEEEPVTETWYDIEKGTLLFNMDFDKANDGNAVAGEAYDAISLGSYSAGAGELVSGLGRLNSDVPGNYDVGFRYTTSGSATLAEENGNKYLSLNSSGSNQISMYLGNTYTKTGKYVFEYKYKLVSTGATAANNITYNTLTPVEGGTDAYTFDTWVTETATFEVSSIPSYSRVMFYGAGNYSTSDKLYLDDIKVWYYDESVDYDAMLNPDIETNDVWEDEEKGTKLFTIDFTAKNNKKAIDSSSWDTIKDRLDNNPSNGELISDIGRINPDVDGSAYRISFNYIDNSKTEIITEGDNKYLSVASDASHGDISLYLGGFYDGEGEYIIETSYKFVQKGTNTVDRIRYETLGLEYMDSSYLSRGEWVDLSETHEHASCTHGNVNRTRFTTEGYNNNPFSADDRIYIDNITVYYQNPDFEAPADPEWTDEEMGTRLYTIDFETKNDGSALSSSDYSSITSGRLDSAPDSAGVAVSAVGRVNPGYTNNFRINFKDAGTSSLTGTDNKNITQTVSTAMSVFLSNIFVGAGRYTVVFDYNTASDKTFSIHSGFTGGTLTTEAIDSTWTRIKYEFDATDDLSYVRFLSSGPSAEGKYMFDNFNVYFKQTMADVTVKANGNANVSDTVVSVNAANGATVGDIVANVDTSASTKYLLGASLTSDGELLAADYVIKPSEVSEIYLIWGEDLVVDDTPWWDDGYGTLLFNINWDGTLSSAEQTRWADVRAAGAVTNPDWKCYEKCYFMWGAEDIGGTTWVPAKSPLIVSEANGNRYYTEPHEGTYNYWSIYSTFDGDYANWADTAGVFTVTYKIKTIGNITVNNLFMDPQTVKDHSRVQTGIRLYATESPDSSGWTTVTYQFDLSEYNVSEGESLGHVMIYAQTNEASAVSGAYICYDDVKVYYKPSKVNVTMKPGTNLEVNETVVEVTTAGILVSDLIALVNTEDTTLLATGIATEDGSKKYALTDTVVLDKDETFVITWETNSWMDNEKGMLIQKADFEGEFQTTTINRWPVATALGATINPEYSFEGITGLQFTVSETGIAFDSSMLWIPADYDKTENGNTYFEVPTANKDYGATQQLTCISMYAMGKGASQYQYQGAGTYTITGKVKYGTDIQNAIFEVRPNLYNGDGGLSGGYNYQFTDFNAGEWNDFSVTWSTTEDSEYGLGSVQFYLFHDALSAASTIAYDDIMLYYKPFKAEVTLRANNNPVAKDVVLSDMSTGGFTVEELISNIRTPLGGMDLVGIAYDKAGTNMLEGTVVVGGDARFFMIWEESELDPNAPISVNECSIRTDDPIGLRFKARLDKPVHEKAERIGWIITRYDFLEEAEINPYDFFMETAITKVSAFNKDTDGTNKVFASDDLNTFVTAVLYNIPEEHYRTTLVARPLTVVDGTTYYGFPIECSLCDIAEIIRDEGYVGCTNDQKVYIMSILAACGEPTEPQVTEQ